MKNTFVNAIADYYQQREEEQESSAETFDVSGMGVWPFDLFDDGKNPRLKKLLVVDDEAGIRNNYAHIFSREGFSVLTASSSMEANELLAREKINLMFLDINMAEVDGGTFFEVVRSFHPCIKVVVTSVYPIEEQMERIRNADAYHDKADGKDALLGIVSSLMA